MRLDSKAMHNIIYLEREYGQLSNVPEDHNLIKKLKEYGINNRINMVDKVTFYLSYKNVEQLEELSKLKGKIKTVTLRNILIEFSKNPIKVDISDDYKKDKRFILLMPEKEYNEIERIAKEYGCSSQRLTTHYLNKTLDDLRK